MRRIITLACAGLALLGALPPALACSICGSIGDQKTFRQDAGDSKLILFGTLDKSTPNAGGAGSTDFSLTKVIKTDPILGDKKTLEIPRYIPIDKNKEHPRYLLFVDVFKGKLDFFRGVPVQSADAVDYVQGLVKIDPTDRSKLLLHCFNYLEHPDKEIAYDAYLELAKASDQEIGQIAGKLAPEKLRGWIKNPKTPQERLGLYAFLLGGCGKDADAAFLRSLLDKPSERILPAYDGILDGYIQLRPKEGWDFAKTVLHNEKQPFQARFAIVRTLRFFHNWKPEATEANVLPCLRLVLAQGDLADLAVADLIRWKNWDLTADVLALYGKKSHDAPIVRRSIVRYALLCPKPAAAAFVAECRKQDAELVSDVEEGLQLEKGK
ncbi:MAG: hypothetical protein ACJ8FY_01505 [Gemmataceae bacterium]